MTTTPISHPEAPVIPKRYSETAVRSILEYALADQLDEKDFSQDQLQAMVRELGISTESLALAEQRWLDEAPQRALHEERATFERHRQWTYRTTLTMAVISTVFLVLLNLVTSPGTWWVIYPLMGWVVAIVIYTWMIRQQEGPLFEQEFAHWRASRPLPEPSGRHLSS